VGSVCGRLWVPARPYSHGVDANVQADEEVLALEGRFCPKADTDCRLIIKKINEWPTEMSDG